MIGSEVNPLMYLYFGSAPRKMRRIFGTKLQPYDSELQKGSPLASGNVITAFRHIYLERGVRGLFAGVAPRVGQVSIGGAIFLGLYDITKRMWTSALY
ncbi:unnamed protein product [Dibothriocephalus latus]|uniref:Uncharacterized protein n=1 Tax=Dibothriocephalus latus TaxID=60516 RepID=A0A3P7NZZ2_DIBLA|nr:unnamed protein product [Dibothriocephalus latus]